MIDCNVRWWFWAFCKDVWLIGTSIRRASQHTGSATMWCPAALDLGFAFVQSAFENGSRDVFSLTTPQLGAVQTMTLGHNGKGVGAAWQLESAELEKVSTGA